MRKPATLSPRAIGITLLTSGCRRHRSTSSSGTFPVAPWPARKGGVWLQLYAHSLSITLLVLFALSFWLHLLGSTRRANEEALLHAAPAETAAERLADPEFWYESFQNWQSEFLAICALVVLGIFLRERGSPESKPVHAPHSQTGR
jgi:hypothetical protein